MPSRCLFLISLACMALIYGCCCNRTGKQSGNLEDSEILLARLTYSDGVLAGEVVNNSKKQAVSVVVVAEFLDQDGKSLLMQELKVVPGGDGRALLPRQAKRFQYKVVVNAMNIKVVGKIKTVIYE